MLDHLHYFSSQQHNLEYTHYHHLTVKPNKANKLLIQIIVCMHSQYKHAHVCTHNANTHMYALTMQTHTCMHSQCKHAHVCTHNVNTHMCALTMQTRTCVHSQCKHAHVCTHNANTHMCRLAM